MLRLNLSAPPFFPPDFVCGVQLPFIPRHSPTSMLSIEMIELRNGKLQMSESTDKSVNANSETMIIKIAHSSSGITARGKKSEKNLGKFLANEVI
jgi:hypothetical protein